LPSKIECGKTYKIINERGLKVYGTDNPNGLFLEYESLKILQPNSEVLVVDTDGDKTPLFYKCLDAILGIVWIHRLCLMDLSN
jgi:hypothetical protein